MADHFDNPAGEDVERLDEPALRAAVRLQDLSAPEGTCWVQGRPYLTMAGMLEIAARFEREGNQEMADLIRQRVEGRRKQAYERLLARGLTGNKAGLVVVDQIGAAVPDTDRDPMPGHVRFALIIFMAVVGLVISAPVILRETIAFFSRF